MRASWIAAGLLLLASAAFVATQNGMGTCVEGLGIATDHDAGTVLLSWSATAGAASYHVERTLDGGAPEIVAVLPAANTSHFEMPPEGILDYRVAADGPPGEDCLPVSTHLGGEPVPPDEPVCVGGLAAQALANGDVNLTWPALTGAISYDILRAEGAGPLAPFALRDGSVTFLLDETTEAGVTYRYAVHANGLVREGRCEEVEVTAVPFLAGPEGALAALAAVGALAALRRRRAQP